MRAPLRLIEPDKRGVVIRTRGVSASTTLRSRVAVGPSAVGSAAGLATATLLPFTTLLTGGLAVGKNRCCASGQPNRISAASATNRTRLRLSSVNADSLRNGA